jgi:hypothetical protein
MTKKTKPQFWVLDTSIKGHSERTLQAHGPFTSQTEAEQWLKDTSADDWLSSCGCLRTGDPQTWGDEYLIVQVVRKVKPVPPTKIEMKLEETK